MGERNSFLEEKEEGGRRQTDRQEWGWLRAGKERRTGGRMGHLLTLLPSRLSSSSKPGALRPHFLASHLLPSSFQCGFATHRNLGR